MNTADSSNRTGALEPSRRTHRLNSRPRPSASTVSRAARLAAAAIASIALCAPDLAAKVQTITIYREGVLGGVVVAEGAYRIEIAPSLDAVTLYRGRSKVLTAPCKVALLERPVAGDSVSYGRAVDGKEEILRIQLQAAKLSFDFGSGVDGAAAVAKADVEPTKAAE